MMDDIDITKDYYKVLGVKSSATIEEMKAAYVSLALTHHPDTSRAEKENNKAAHEEFAKISEAWGILSKADLKAHYDSRRARLTGSNSSGLPSSGVVGLDQSEICQGFTTQRENYSANVRVNASSNWRDFQDKYRSPKWQKMTLNEKKAHRSRPVVSSRLGLAVIVIPVVVAGAFIYSHF
eukprot:gene2269-2484_t